MLYNYNTTQHKREKELNEDTENKEIFWNNNKGYNKNT
jgi:hypothetical protein